MKKQTFRNLSNFIELHHSMLISNEEMKKIKGGDPDAWTCYCTSDTNQNYGWSMQYLNALIIYENCGLEGANCTPIYI